MIDEERFRACGLESVEVVTRAFAPIVKHLPISEEIVIELLHDRAKEIHALIESYQEPEVRKHANEWWGRHKKDFPSWGVGILAKVSSPSKLPYPTYQQLIFLMWLTDDLPRLSRERFRARIEESKRPVMVPKQSIWQKIANRWARWCEELWGFLGKEIFKVFEGV